MPIPQRLVASVFAVVLLGASLACQQAPAPPAADAAAADEAGAHRAHEAYVTAINSNRLEGFLATVTDDVAFMPPNSSPLEGKQAVGAWVKDYFAAYESRWVKTSKEFVVRGDLAYEWYAYESTDTPRAGGPAAGTPVVTDRGNGINIYRRGADGTWRVWRDGWATSAPVPAVAPADK